MIAPIFYSTAILSQINSSGGIEANWFLGFVVAGFCFIMWNQFSDVKKETRENTKLTRRLQMDMVQIKLKLGIKITEEDQEDEYK